LGEVKHAFALRLTGACLPLKLKAKKDPHETNLSIACPTGNAHAAQVSAGS